MKRKKQISKKHRPLKYRKFKGCFGGYSSVTKPEEKKRIKFPEILELEDDKAAMGFLKAITESLEHPDRIADFARLKIVSLQCGIILKSYSERFYFENKRRVTLAMPKDKKSKAVLRFLGLIEGEDNSYLNYDDLKCWHMKVFDKNNQADVKELIEDFIPHCWESHKYGDKETRDVATVVAESLYNCAEHAYENESSEISFQKWYLGAGEYPKSKVFYFCVFDMGQGFKNSMKKNTKLWGKIFSDRDCDYIARAVKGTTGVKNGARMGRGLGLSTCVDTIKRANGDMEILSGRGKYTTLVPNREALDRKTDLKGSLVSFFVPIERKKPLS